MLAVVGHGSPRAMNQRPRCRSRVESAICATLHASRTTSIAISALTAVGMVAGGCVGKGDQRSIDAADVRIGDTMTGRYVDADGAE